MYLTTYCWGFYDIEMVSEQKTQTLTLNQYTSHNGEVGK